MQTRDPVQNETRDDPSRLSSSMISVPVISLGIKSGVNCTREYDRSSARDTVCTSSVLARPGTPTNTTCPPANSAATRSSTTCAWPTIRCAICVVSSRRACERRSSSATSFASEGAFTGRGQEKTNREDNVNYCADPLARITAERNRRAAVRGSCRYVTAQRACTNRPTWGATARHRRRCHSTRASDFACLA